MRDSVSTTFGFAEVGRVFFENISALLRNFFENRIFRCAEMPFLRTSKTSE